MHITGIAALAEAIYFQKRISVFYCKILIQILTIYNLISIFEEITQNHDFKYID